MSAKKRIALVGNPNSGKTSLFNYLTGLRQKVGNYPGITVDRKIGTYAVENGILSIVDLPGTYSLFPQSQDERVVTDRLINKNHPERPEGILYVADINALDKQLLLLSQIKDLGYPTAMILTMSDLRHADEVQNITSSLKKHFNIPVLPVSIQGNQHLDEIKSFLGSCFFEDQAMSTPSTGYDQRVRHALEHDNAKEALDIQYQDTMERYAALDPLLQSLYRYPQTEQQGRTNVLDQWITHPVIGPCLFLLIMLFTFQAIFAWSSVPMDFIESSFGTAGEWIRYALGSGKISDFLVDGVLAGIGGVVIFIPQIALLFFLLAVLEESGYMARAVYLFDPLMRKFGLSGRSIVALVSSGACAIPAIMSARTIKNEEERLRTILVSPLISCSARLPVYTVLIGLMVPAGSIYGFNKQGLVFMGVYILSIVSTLLVSLILTYFLGNKKTSTLSLELPIYRRPQLKSIIAVVWSKVKVFILEAGKIILVISMVLWFLASYGPGDHAARAKEEVDKELVNVRLTEEAYNNQVASRTLEYSYIGIMGRWIEPVIKPLGYDWKIGIALITSFAAREVFVGTMATIYSIGSDDEATIKERLASAVHPRTGEKVYTLATVLSLLWFYIYAMQCMSTLAIAKRETAGWKWPMFMLGYMTFIAVAGSFFIYQVLG